MERLFRVIAVLGPVNYLLEEVCGKEHVQVNSNVYVEMCVC